MSLACFHWDYPAQGLGLRVQAQGSGVQGIRACIGELVGETLNELPRQAPVQDLGGFRGTTSSM